MCVSFCGCRVFGKTLINCKSCIDVARRNGRGRKSQATHEEARD